MINIKYSKTLTLMNCMLYHPFHFPSHPILTFPIPSYPISFNPNPTNLSCGTPKTDSQTLLRAIGNIKRDIVSIAISPNTRAYLISNWMKCTLFIRFEFPSPHKKLKLEKLIDTIVQQINEKIIHILWKLFNFPTHLNSK